MNRNQAPHRWRAIIFFLLLALATILGILSSVSHQPAQHSDAIPDAAAKSAPADIAPALPVALPDKRKVHRASVRARLRIHPGETAVMGYREIDPGKLGMTMVTPEWRENGQVFLQIRTLQLTDSEALGEGADELLPHVFELEKTGVISQTRMAELLRSLIENEDVRKVSYPSMTTRPGQACSMQTGINEPGGEFLGVSYALRVDAIPGSEGYDLSVDFEHTGTRAEE